MSEETLETSNEAEVETPATDEIVESSPTESVEPEEVQPDESVSEESEVKEPEAEETQEEQKESRASRRIRQLIQKNKDKEARIKQLEAESKRRQEETNNRQKALTEKEQLLTRKPDRLDYDSDEEYYEALMDHKVEQREAARLKTEINQSHQHTQEIENQKMEIIAQTYNENNERGKSKYEDFDEIALKTNANVITQEMAKAAHSCENYEDVAYYLGKNPQDATNIASLPPMLQIMEIGKLSQELSAREQSKPNKKITKAPQPVSPVGDGRSGEVDPFKMSTSDYIAWKNKQEGIV